MEPQCGIAVFVRRNRRNDVRYPREYLSNIVDRLFSRKNMPINRIAAAPTITLMPAAGSPPDLPAPAC